MRKIDKSGLELCDLQARAFKISKTYVHCGSEIFIRRFMNSEIARILDSEYGPYIKTTPEEVTNDVFEQYGATSRMILKYPEEELFWMGYMYRYFAYTYEKTSLQAYKIIRPCELRRKYADCHVMNCAAAWERILETLGVEPKDPIEKQYRIFRRVRKDM